MKLLKQMKYKKENYHDIPYITSKPSIPDPSEVKLIKIVIIKNSIRKLFPHAAVCK